MSKKVICDLCGYEIMAKPLDYTYDLALKQRRGGITAEASLDICEECVKKTGLYQKLQSKV